MSEPESAQAGNGRPLKRRGLIAGAAALMAAALAKLAGPERTESGHGVTAAANGDTKAIHRNQANTATGTTGLNSTGGTGLEATSSSNGGVGLRGTSMTGGSEMITIQPRAPAGVGEPAPDFTLPTVPQEGIVSLADYRGKSPVLLAIMRGLWCPFCRRHLAQLGTTRRSCGQWGSRLWRSSPRSPSALGFISSSARRASRWQPTRADDAPSLWLA